MSTASSGPRAPQRRVYLVRHGETEYSARHAYSGQAEIALTQTGREQARRVGERLAGAGVDAVYSSPLGRASETAKAITEATGVPLTIDERLIEVDYGPLEGLDRHSARERFGVPFDDWRSDPFGSPLAGMEPLDHALERARDATSDALAASECRVLVGHQGILRLVLVALGQIEPSAYFSTRLQEAEPIEVVPAAVVRA